MQSKVYLMLCVLGYFACQLGSSLDMSALVDQANEAFAKIERELTSRQFHDLVAIEEALTERGFNKYSIKSADLPDFNNVVEAVAKVFKSQSAVAADGSNLSQVYDERVIAPCEVVSAQSEKLYSKLKGLEHNSAMLDAVSEEIGEDPLYWTKYAYLCNEIILKDLRREVGLKLKQN